MQPTATKRFLALDVFRGLTLCLMIIVNNGGNGATTYAPLCHANWHGFTLTDLVFPSFLFAVGNALSFVMKSWNKKTNAEILKIIFKRTFIIFLLGFLMYWFPFFKMDKFHNIISFPFSTTRFLGVLQRIALCYCIAALMVNYLKPKTNIILSILFLIIYWVLMINFGDLTMKGNLGQKIDLFLFGEKHLYHGEGIAFDPEGLLSTLPSIVNVLAGYFVGVFIQKNGKNINELIRLSVLGFGLVMLAILCNYNFPVNKKLWTSSFVLITVGLDCIVIACLVVLIEVKNIKTGTYFFEVFGKNPIVIYLFSELFVVFLWMTFIDKKYTYVWIYQNIFKPTGDYFGSFLFAIAYMLICWLLGYVMDKKKIYIRV